MAKDPIPNNPTLVTEEASQKELASTSVGRGVARALAVGFCVALLVPVVAQLAGGGGLGDFAGVGFPPTRETLAALGRNVDDGSVLKKWVQPRLQMVLTGWGGFGNEKVTIGRDGWLYYAPGLRYLFGQPFLDADYLKAKAKGMIDKDGLAVAHPDPLPAFRQLAEDCKRLGIQLVVAPVPDKGMLIGTAQNADFGKFRAAVEGYGATVLPLEKWMETGDAPWYLRQDTHWTPRFMDRVARGMAESLKGKVWAAPAPLYRLRAATAESRGDLVGMLKLPVDQTLFGAERVAIDVVEPVGDVGPAEVLLLGDSFTNIYSSPSLEWGQKAGLGEHLAYHLNAPVDVIAMNGAGATVRNELLRAARTGRLAATRVLVYEFAIRDLYLEDWPVVALGDVERKLISRETKPVEATTPVAVAEEKPLAPVAAPVVADSERVVLRGWIVQMSRAIQPGTAPYEDALIYGKVKVEQVVSGSYGKPEAIVVFLAMRKRVLLPGAGHKVGDTLQLRLVRLKSAPEEIRSMQRSDDTEDFDLTPYFVEEELP